MNILDKRLVVVTGKGGVGKSIVAAALAHLASRRGKNTLLVEMDTEDRLGTLFEAAPLGDKIAPVRENVSGIDLDPRTVLEDFFRAHLKVRAIYGQILDSRLFNHFYQAAPALKELVCLGKLFRLVEERSWWSSRPKWDLVVFDAPATGHGLGLLDVPRSASQILLGSMKTNALRIHALLRDPAITSLQIVTIPEEMPVNEAALLHEQAKTTLGMPLGHLFVNAVVPESFTADEARDLENAPADELARAARAAFGVDGEAAGPALARAVRRDRERARLSSHYVRAARERIPLPVIEIPALVTDHFGWTELERVAAAIAPQLAGERAPAIGARA